MQTIFFFYGLAFIVMGIVIFVVPKKRDLLGLSEDLCLVGLFGILHGMNEWVDLFILRGTPFNPEVLKVLGSLFLPVSFVPLLQFGVRALFRGTSLFQWVKYLWAAALLGWAGAYFMTRDFLIPGIMARYFICAPGAFLTAFAIFRKLLKVDHNKNIPATVWGGAIGATVFFVLYGILSGLVVPRAGFFPASWIHYENFLQFAGIPVQFFRMVCAVLLAVSFFAMTGIYTLSQGNHKIIRRGGIRRKITLWLSAMVFLVFIFFSVLSYRLVLQLRTQTFGEALQGDATLIAVSISRLFSKEMEELRIYFNDPEWKEFLAEANASQGSRAPVEREDYFKQMDRKWANPSGEGLEQYLSGPMTFRLKNYADTEERLAEVFLTDRYGGLVAASGKTTDFFQADESWWHDTFDGGKGRETVQDVAWDDSSKALSVDLAIPVKNAEGGVIGIAKQVMKVQALFKYLQDYRIGKTGHAVLINGAGYILFHQEIEPLTTKFYSEKGLVELLQSDKKWAVLFEPHSHKEEMLVAFAKVDSPVLEANGIRWYVFVDQSKAEILAPLWKIWLILGSVGGIFLLICLGIVYILANRLAEPLHQLSLAAEEIRKGNWDYVADIHSADEIQTLAESFRFMVEDLRQRQSELLRSKGEIETLSHGLEKKVEERTKDLSESQRATMNILEDLTEANEKLKRFTAELTQAKNELEAKSREIQRSKEFLDNTGWMAKVGGWELDLATQALSWTDETYRIHELEIGSVPSLAAAIHFYAPESLPILQEAIRKASATGESFDLELEFIPAKTKKRIWVRSMGSAIVEDGKIVKLRGTFQDIDVRKRAETEIRKFQRAMEQSPATVVITDRQGAIEYVNPKFTETTGYTRDEALGQNPRILKSGELSDKVYKELWKTITSGEEWRGEFHNKRKNGELYWEFASISPIRDAQGVITHFLAVKEDITERKQIEKALGESEKKFRSLVANIPGIVYRCKMDPDWTMLYLSEEVDRISGYPATDFINNSVRSYASIIFKEDVAFVERSIRDTVAQGKHWEIEYRVIHKDGLVRWVYEKGRGVTDAAGAVQYLDGFILDISDRKRAEEIILGKTKELELQSWGLQKANDGIQALYHELEKKNAELAKLDRLKDDFVSIVAHELRNPLGVVREAASLILDGLVGPIGEEQKKYLDIIRRTGDRLIHITTDLLDLAKIEAGKIVVNFEKIDLLSMARQSCEGIALRANKKGLTISQDFPEGKLEISGDFDKLSQVMSNLLSNAFKFTEQGGITVEVKDLGEEIQCAVRDTGPGISKENIARLFSKFEQFGKPTTHAEKGSGLGLVISQSIILAHGGRIWAESEPGKGSSFIFTLPKQHRQKKLGEILLEEKTLTSEQLTAALLKQNGQKS